MAFLQSLSLYVHERLSLYSPLTSTHYVLLLLLQLCHHNSIVKGGTPNCSLMFLHLYPSPLLCYQDEPWLPPQAQRYNTLYIQMHRVYTQHTYTLYLPSLPRVVWQPQATAKALENAFISQSSLCSVNIKTYAARCSKYVERSGAWKHWMYTCTKQVRWTTAAGKRLVWFHQIIQEW